MELEVHVLTRHKKDGINMVCDRTVIFSSWPQQSEVVQRAWSLGLLRNGFSRDNVELEFVVLCKEFLSVWFGSWGLKQNLDTVVSGFHLGKNAFTSFEF